jgi:hypothetical protein
VIVDWIRNFMENHLLSVVFLKGFLEQIGVGYVHQLLTTVHDQPSAFES